MASIAYENILRFSQHCLRSTLTGRVSLARMKKNAQLATCYSLFPSKSMCKTIRVGGKGKGVRGGKCGKPTSNSLSFSITKSVTTKHPVDVTSPHIARGCRPVLQPQSLSLPIRRMDSLRYATSAVGALFTKGHKRWSVILFYHTYDLLSWIATRVCVGGGGRGRPACGRAGASPSGPHLSLCHHVPPRPPPAQRRLTGTPVRSRNTERTGGWRTRRRSLITGVRLQTKTLLHSYLQQIYCSYLR